MRNTADKFALFFLNVPGRGHVTDDDHIVFFKTLFPDGTANQQEIPVVTVNFLRNMIFAVLQAVKNIPQK